MDWLFVTTEARRVLCVDPRSRCGMSHPFASKIGTRKAYDRKVGKFEPSSDERLDCNGTAHCIFPLRKGRCCLYQQYDIVLREYILRIIKLLQGYNSNHWQV